MSNSNDAVFVQFEFTKFGVDKKQKVGQKGVHDFEFYTSGNYLNYISREEAVYIQDNNSSTEELKRNYLTSNLTFDEWYKSKTKAASKSDKSGVYKLFSDRADDLNEKEIKELNNHVKKLSKEQNIWEMIINLGDVDGEKYFFVDKNQWNDVLSRTLSGLLKNNGLKPKDIDGFYTLHANTGKPHLHLCFYENKPSFRNGTYRPKGAFKKESISHFAQMFKAEVTNPTELAKLQNIKSTIWNDKKMIKADLKNRLNDFSSDFNVLSKIRQIKHEYYKEQGEHKTSYDWFLWNREMLVCSDTH
ncbi:hypothetical protein H9M94_01055 [Mycoplasma sp. Pen4]|uniref:relaxase MobL n=1 Tax=Mycoplasma sp. Pen4 TaxID=640330 RepID=UPI001653FA13|nr:relaxase MobL [Mycoplasma sp. Pen4]QNM93847.1 hypothetical protein H9M94_01055 [Mycoplasma sp. Pen4]